MNVSFLAPETIVNEVFALYEKQGNAAPQLQHVSQAAALAEEEGFEDEVILAAFFHDIGYLCPMGKACNDGMDRERMGADFLREHGFSERLASLVESHVLASRYLAYKYSGYYEQLPDSGKSVLELYGGRMSKEEAAMFELNPDAELFIRLRYWDDMAKEVNKQAPDISYIKLLAMSHLYKNN